MESGHHHHNRSNHHQTQHRHHVEDFGRRFWISLVLTLPILVLSPMFQKFIAINAKALKFKK